MRNMRKLTALMVVTSLAGWGCASGPEQRAERKTDNEQVASGKSQQSALPQQEATEEDELFGRSYEQEGGEVAGRNTEGALPQQEATEEDELFGRSYEDEQAQGTGGAAGAGAEQKQQGQTQQGQMQQGQRGMQGTMQPPQARQLDEGQWLAELMLANGWATDMSKIASNQAVTPSVRQFAQQMVQTHQSFGQQLQQLAQREGIDMTQAMQQGEQNAKQDFMHAAILTSLAGLPMLNGVNLDRAYLSSVVLSHDLAVNKLQWALTQVKNPKLAQAIQDELTTLVKNRQQAHRLLGQVAPEVKRGQARRAPADRR